MSTKTGLAETGRSDYNRDIAKTAATAKTAILTTTAHRSCGSKIMFLNAGLVL